VSSNKDGTNNIQALAGDDTITGGIDARNNIDGGADLAWVNFTTSVVLLMRI
jgi:hypothetical protein